MATAPRIVVPARVRAQLARLPVEVRLAAQLHLENVSALAARGVGRLAPLLTGTGGRAVAELGGGVRLSYAVEPHSGLVLLHAVG